MSNPVSEAPCPRGKGATEVESHGGARSYQKLLSFALVVPVSLGVFLASYTGLFGRLGLDSLLEAKFLNYITPFEKEPFSPEIEIIMVPETEEDPRAGELSVGLRRKHAELVDALAAVQARVIAFDLHFKQSSSEHDPAFVQAIKRAQERVPGTTVVVGALFNPEVAVQPTVTGSSVLGAGLERKNWGLIDVWRVPSKAHEALGKLQLAVRFPTDPKSRIQRLDLIPSLVLQTFLSARTQGRKTETIFSAGKLRVRVPDRAKPIEIPIDEDLQCIVELVEGNELNPYPYDRVYEKRHDQEFMERFRDKIVLIGPEKSDEHSVGEDTTLRGVEIQASAVSNLLQGIHITSLRPLSQFLVILVMGLVGASLRLWPGGWTGRRFSLERIVGSVPFVPPFIKETPIPLNLILVLLIYFVFVSAAYQLQRVVIAFNYDVSALFLAYWIVGVLSRGSSDQESPEAASVVESPAVEAGS